MSVGIYGSVKNANVTFNDVDVLYTYQSSREQIGDLQMTPVYQNPTDGDVKKVLGADGLYKLRLPANIFNQVGFYSILIKPKSFETEIIDCTFVVTSDDNQIEISKKGIVIPALQFQQSNGLVGYQIEYYDNNGVKINNLHRIVTSSNLVSVSTNNTTIQSGNASKTYVLDNNGTNLFLTLSPDENYLVSNSQDIGGKGQTVEISNTFFDPLYVEVEMVDQNLKTLSYALYGNSTRDLQSGVYSIFDENNQLYKQFNLYTEKNQFTQGNIDIKEQRTSINLSQNFTQISQGIGG
jgi:hypothetical protein